MFFSMKNFSQLWVCFLVYAVAQTFKNVKIPPPPPRFCLRIAPLLPQRPDMQNQPMDLIRTECFSNINSLEPFIP